MGNSYMCLFQLLSFLPPFRLGHTLRHPNMLDDGLPGVAELDDCSLQRVLPI